MTSYTKIKSKFIKEKIKKTKWKDSEYIDDLMFLEDAILNDFNNLGMSGNMKLSSLKYSYSKEYKVIYKELDPKGWKEEQEQEKKQAIEEAEEERRYNEEERLEEEQERKEWKKAGGKI